MDTIKEALTFDDVLLLPKFSSILPNKTNISIVETVVKYNQQRKRDMANKIIRILKNDFEVNSGRKQILLHQKLYIHFDLYKLRHILDYKI